MNMIMLEMGDDLKSICGECLGDCIFDHFYGLNFQDSAIETILGKNMRISPKLTTLSISGKFEDIDGQKLFLFAGQLDQSRGVQVVEEERVAPLEITGKKTGEFAPLLGHKSSLDSVIENMSFGFIEMDAEGRIIYANKSFCSISGYHLSHIRGKLCSLLFANQFFCKPNVHDTDGNLGSDLYEIEFLDANGVKKLLIASCILNYNERHENIGWTNICFDVSQHKVFIQELITAKLDAEKTASAKEMFLANMSHEIRTPMNAIISMSSQLSKTSLTYQQDYFVQTVQTASKNLLVIIDDILDLTKIDAGKLNLEYIGFSLPMVLTDVMQVIMHRAEKKGLEIIFANADQTAISPVLIGDPYRINQVILNLMSNAIKFTEKGSVSLEAVVLRDQVDHQTIEISVKDTGIGMDPEFVAHLFENFTQEYESVSRKYGGTGLGMSISQKLVAQMGGHFNVKSEKGKGSDISFVIDLKKGITTDVPNEVLTVHNEELFADRRILIIDDNDMNRLVASTILLSYGAQVMIAEGGEIALEMVENELYDLILMDIQMPVMNGYDTTKVLRARGYTGAIVALTASAVSGEKEKCLAAGMDDYITKPINEETFISVVDTWIRNKAAPVRMPGIDQPLYNLDGLRTISKGREDFVTKMIQMFCNNMPESLNELNLSIEENDLARVSKLAHKLKSNIDHLGIISLQRTIRNIESLSEENGPIVELLPMIAEVNSVVDQVVKELKVEILKRK